MKIIGIDPGTVNSAWLVYECDTFADGIPCQPQIHERDYCDNETLLHMLRALNEDDYDAVAIEWIQNQGRTRVGNETFDTQGWAGRFLEAAYPVRGIEISRRKVIGHLVGSYGGDAQVIKALRECEWASQSLLKRATRESKPQLGPNIVVRSGGDGAMREREYLDTTGITSHMWQALGVAVTCAESVLAVENPDMRMQASDALAEKFRARMEKRRGDQR